MSRVLKATAIALALLVTLLVLPWLPNRAGQFVGGKSDPNVIVMAELSQDELEEIELLVRGGDLISPYKRVFGYSPFPILSIAKDEGDRYRTGRELKREPARGDIIVLTGVQRGPRDGAGVTYYLKKIDGQWIVVETRRWTS